MSRRIYNSEARQAQAAKTRERILASAKKLFQTKGFDKVTIDKLAETAGVSPSSIYSLFKSKRNILRILMDEALPPKERATLVEEAMREKSATKRLAIAAKISRKMYDAERSLMDIFRGASVIAPELKKLEKEREQRRYKRLEESAKMLAKEKVLPKGMSLTQAHDILWAFTGRDMYRLMVIDRGWSPEVYEKWLANQLISMLLEK